MATSGSYNYNATANDVITEALGLVGVYSPGESIDNSEVSDALRSLNMMLKSWQAKHIGLWLNKELALFLQDDTLSYDLGPTGDNCSSSFAKTEVATAAASAATSVVVDAITGFGNTFDRNGIVTAVTPAGAGSITLDGALVTTGISTLTSERKILIYSDGDDSGVAFGITGQDAEGVAVTESITGPNTTTVYSTETYKTISSITIDGAGTGNIEIGQVGDHVGIELDGGTVHWTYFSAAVTTTTLSIVTALTGAVAVDNHVYTYKEKTPRPIELIEVRLHKNSDYEQPLSIYGRNEYMLLSNKTSEGSPNQVYFDRQLTNSVLKTWPVCNDVKEYLKFTARLPIQDLDNLADDFEVGQEWFEPIAWNLAVRLFPKYGKPIDPMIKLMADEMFENAKAFDSEQASSFIQVLHG